MTEESTSKGRYLPRPLYVVLVMLLLILILPYVVQTRYDIRGWDSIILYGWFWSIPLVGTYPYGMFFPQTLFDALMHTGLQILFCFVLAGYYMGLVSRKHVMQAGYLSAFPSLLVFSMNFFGTWLNVSRSIHFNIIAPIPFLIPTIFGLALLYRFPLVSESDGVIFSETQD